jgi:hypothetical protein
VLDDAAVQIDDVQRSVRPIQAMDRPKALVGRGQELGLLVGVVRSELPLDLVEDIAADEIAGGLADEGVALALRQGVAAIDTRSTARRDGDKRPVRAQVVITIDAGRDPRRIRVLL